MVIATSIILVGCGQSNNKKQNGDQDMDNKDNVQDIDMDDVKVTWSR